ncbi:YggN family protein [Vibrio sp. SS-MA-C1-2]|uniref:DUF2884 family protein n=1 Tax=Vibrio sp. SS-MA-C1-2 TaxID=2908646 RepID=UPI001F3E8180|nr:DUF2884 family protein [Vibrio sp. SS-MA-C1-2]UJF17575.1 YggN family protein [Vibrio sp. SS-MA-C1-2]
MSKSFFPQFTSKIAISTLLMASFSTSASLLCPVELKSDVVVQDQQVEIQTPSQPKVLMTSDNKLFIGGKEISLDNAQQQALKSYREGVTTYLPQISELIQEGLTYLRQLLGQIAESIDSKELQQKFDKLVDNLEAKINKEYYTPEGFAFQPQDMSQLMSDWKKEFVTLKDQVSSDSVSVMLEQMSTEMSDGGVNLTEWKAKFDDAKAKLETSLKIETKELQAKANSLCQSMTAVAEQEDELIKTIPDLKDHQLFEIQ